MNYTIGSLFAGVGGFDLGFERAGFTTSWQVEINPYCRKVLEKNFPHAERFSDIRDCGAHNLMPVDVICGGFPCQDISNAGRRAGIDGERSGLWSEMFRIISELRPSYLLVENSAALLGRGMGRVVGELSSIGYDAEWQVIPACAVGADHIRERVWILSYPTGTRVESIYEQWRLQCEKKVGEDASDYHSSRLSRRLQTGENSQDAVDLGAWSRSAIDTATSFSRLDRAGAAVLGRGEDGIPNRVDRMHAIGNAVVPQIPELIARQIKQVLEVSA